MSVERIGEAAGAVWTVLSEKGELAPAQIQKATRLTKGLVDQALGWLAREGKIELTDSGKKATVRLKVEV